jgi:hypothetical protein
MRGKAIEQALTAGLEAEHDIICAHLGGLKPGRSTDIEKTMAVSFLKQLGSQKFEKEVPLKALGNTRSGNLSSRTSMDCVLVPQGIGIEFKAIRLPRINALGSSGVFWDIGQLTHDYIRITDSRKLTTGYIIIFVYGPLVADAKTDGMLYRHFHNQMFIDYSAASVEQQWSQGDNILRRYRARQRQVCKKLGWDRAWPGRRAAAGALVAKVGDDLGMIGFECKR